VQNNPLPVVPVSAHPVLSVSGLNVTFRSRLGPVPAVRDVDFDIARGEVFAIIGESGSGKSSLAMAMMDLLPRSALVTGQIRLAGIDLNTLSGSERRRICGERVSLISQDALSSLNPCTTVGYQIAEMLMVHRGMGKRDAMAAAIRLLTLTGVPSPEGRMHHYPHQFSGGMRQRALIAISLALEPDLVIADEPTTALDATIKAQILQLLARLRAELGMSILIITHDMGVVAKMADRMLVMYAGQAVEIGTVEEVFAHPAHPYTAALLEAVPRLDATERPLRAIPGAPPAPSSLPPGCPFHPRCPVAEPRCAAKIPRPVTLGVGRSAACLLVEDGNVVL
jgi:oligopeptide/dipeptide ABC transporter ATP-binding protein